MKNLIIYYSLNGNTEYAAKLLADKTGSDLIRLSPKSEPPKQGRMKFFIGGFRALFHTTPKLEPLSINLNDYELVIIGTPVWAGTYTPAIGSFLKEYNLKDKKVAIFVSSSSGEGDKTIKQLEDKIGVTSSLKLNLTDPLTHKETEDKKIEEFANKITQLKYNTRI